jgi:hypothetical protein
MGLDILPGIWLIAKDDFGGGFDLEQFKQYSISDFFAGAELLVGMFPASHDLDDALIVDLVYHVGVNVLAVVMGKLGCDDVVL